MEKKDDVMSFDEDEEPRIRDSKLDEDARSPEDASDASATTPTPDAKPATEESKPAGEDLAPSEVEMRPHLPAPESDEQVGVESLQAQDDVATLPSEYSQTHEGDTQSLRPVSLSLHPVPSDPAQEDDTGAHPETSDMLLEGLKATEASQQSSEGDAVDAVEKQDGPGSSVHDLPQCEAESESVYEDSHETFNTDQALPEDST